MVFGLFASMASAATTEPTTAEKYKWFVDQGILKGTGTDDARLGDNLTRAEFATIAAAVGGLKLINTTSSFSDVKVKDWYFTAIQSASDAGLVNGIGGGKFGPKLNVTVEQAVKVAVQLAGIKPVDGAVVAGSSEWAGPYIQAAINAGLAIPSNYKANATRSQTIDISYTVYQLKALPVLSDVAATVNADDTITVSGKVVGSADSVKVALGTAAEVAATLKDDKTFTYTTAKQSPGTYKLTVVAYDGTKASVSVTKEVTIGGFVVESATAINGKQIAVKFNKAVQEGVSVGGATYGIAGTSTAAQTAHVLLDNKEPAAASVSSDKTTVTYTFEPFVNNSYSTLTVSGLKSSSGQTVTSYTAAILKNDTTKPTISGVSYAGKTATLTLSEPIPQGMLGTISLNGATISSKTAEDVNATNNYYVVSTDGHTGYEWVTAIKVYNLTLGANYSFYLVGGQDNAGNYFDYNTTLTAPTDTVAPTVASVTSNGKIITVKFSEPVSTAGAVYNTTSGTVGTPVKTLSDDKLTATYEVDWLGTNTFLNTTVVVKGYKDLVGNAGSDYSAAVTLSVDNTAPTVASASYDGANVYVKYSEAVAFNSASQNIGVSFTSTSNVVSSKSWSTAGAAVGYDLNNDGDYDDDGENFYIRIPVGSLDAGSYSLSVPASLAKDLAGNASSSGSASFTVSAGSASGIVQLLNVTKDGNSVLIFEFNRELAQSALDVAKYTINGVALPTGTTVVFIDDLKHVKATLPAGSIPVNGTRVIAVNNIVDTSGNTLDSGAVSKTIELKENILPIAQSVVVNSDTQLAVTFSETLKTSVPVVNDGKVLVYINGSTTATSVTGYSTYGSTFYINAAPGTFSASQTIQVKFAGADKILDLNENGAADVTINK